MARPPPLNLTGTVPPEDQFVTKGPGMMKFKRFLSPFMRVSSPDPEETTIRFILDDGEGTSQEALGVVISVFDTETNGWTVKLMRKN